MGRVSPDGTVERLLPSGLAIHAVSTLDIDFLYREIFEQEIYVQHGISIAEGSTVMDCGANIGLFSIYAAKAAGSSGRVLSIEPLDHIYSALKGNAASHLQHRQSEGVGCAPITAVRAGIGDGTRDEMDFTLYPSFACWSTMYPQDEEFHQRHIAEYVYRNIAALAGMPPSLYNRAARFFFHITPSWIFNWSMRRYVRNNLLKTDTQRCAMTTVSALMAQHDLDRIDLLKIDVEGAELDVLRGIRPEDWPRIHQVVLEVESFGGEGCTKELDAVHGILGKAGFDELHTDEPLKGSGVFQVYAKRMQSAAANSMQCDASGSTCS